MRTTSTRGATTGRVVALATVAALLVPVLGACGTSGPPGASSTVRADVPADARTEQIAEVEFARQCSVGTQSFPKESDIDADLAKRLTTAGLSHLEWKQWHDSLAVSPQLVTQLAEVGKRGCPKA
ncbi:hypothetical protein [Terrabacter sp. Ter38]|uniref:hypothetical protein n=1 Tax=Terrabacter sp. Ter38 TaxID=2926030 RepID=UPI0021173911|nr:hypothetical protein [Terrabacter sp. Ter38]